MSAVAGVANGLERELGMAERADLELVRRAQAGDTEAFSELVRRTQRSVYHLALRFMRDGNLADDMAQDAYLKAFRLIRGFRGDCSFATWMYRVTCSVCLNELNRRKRRSEVPLEHHEPAPVHPGAPLEKEEVKELVRRSVVKLPEHYATALTLYYLEDVAYEEIARVMDIPLGTLKTWMHRARKQLRRIVEEELQENA